MYGGSIYIKPTNQCYYNDTYCSGCGSKACAILSVSGIEIGLCEDCMKILAQQIDGFSKTTFCHMCDNFVPDSFGDYGKCKRDLSSKYSKHIMDTCEYSVPKQK